MDPLSISIIELWIDARYFFPNHCDFKNLKFQKVIGRGYEVGEIEAHMTQIVTSQGPFIKQLFPLISGIIVLDIHPSKFKMSFTKSIIPKLV